MLRPRSIGIVTSLALIAAALGVSIDTCWALSTLVLPHPLLPDWPIYVLFALVFPLHIRTVLRGRDVLPDLNALPRTRAGWAVAVVFIGDVVLGASGLFRLQPGNPEKHGGQFYADDHGSLTRISEGTYHQLQLSSQRLFTALPAVFYLIAFLVNLGIARESERAS